MHTLEARTFADFGSTPPRELSIDLTVRAIALLIPIWVSLIFVALAVLVANDRSGLRAPGALVVAAVLVGLLAVEALIATWRTTTARRRALAAADVSTPRGRRLPPQLRLAALLLAAAAAAAGVQGPFERENTSGYVDIQQLKVTTDSTLGDYLRSQRVDPDDSGYVHSDLVRQVIVVSYSVLVAANESVRVQTRLFRAERGRGSSSSTLLTQS